MVNSRHETTISAFCSNRSYRPQTPPKALISATLKLSHSEL